MAVLIGLKPGVVTAWKGRVNEPSLRGRTLMDPLSHYIEGREPEVLGSGEIVRNIHNFVWSLFALVNSKKDVAHGIKMWGNMRS